MELLIAFLIAFGVTSKDASVKELTKEEATKLVAGNGLEKEFIIWAAEADDF